MAWAYENIDQHLISRGIYVAPIQSGQGKRACTTGSYHCSGQARDYGDALHGQGGCWNIYNALLPYAQGSGYKLVELIWQNIFWKRGIRIGGIGGHGDHVHGALEPGRWLPVGEVQPGAPAEEPDVMLHEITDISEHQSPGFGIGRDGVIVRASNGRRRDYQWSAHVGHARAAGVPLSMYTYCEPGSTNPEFQADMLSSVAKEAGIPGNVTLWADIEEGGGDLRWFEDRFVARVNAAGYPCGTYAGDYFWGAHGLIGTQGRWIAAYGVNDGTVSRAPSRPWDMHQYTSAGGLDKNRAMTSVRNRLFGRAGKTKPKEPPKMDWTFECEGTYYAAGAPWGLTTITAEMHLKAVAAGTPNFGSVHPMVRARWAEDALNQTIAKQAIGVSV